MDKNLSPIVVFAGDWDEYAYYIGKTGFSIADAKYLWEASQLPAGDFSFVETGVYGKNKAWKHMRELYGYTENERNKYHREFIKFIKDNYPETKKLSNQPDIVPMHMSIVQCAHKVCHMGQVVRNCVGSIKTVCCDAEDSYGKVDMVTVVSNAGVTLGKVGQCKCGKVYYSLNLVVNNTPNKSAMISQLAAASIFSFKEVEYVYLQTKDLIKAEYYLQLMAQTGHSYEHITWPKSQTFSMTLEGTWKKCLWLRYAWRQITWNLFWRWYYAIKWRGYEKDTDR